MRADLPWNLPRLKWGVLEGWEYMELYEETIPGNEMPMLFLFYMVGNGTASYFP